MADANSGRLLATLQQNTVSVVSGIALITGRTVDFGKHGYAGVASALWLVADHGNFFLHIMSACHPCVGDGNPDVHGHKVMTSALRCASILSADAR